MPESASAATDLDLISNLKAIPDARMRRGVRIPAWHLLLVAVLGILSRCQSLRDLERFAIRHHCVLTEALGLELRRPSSDSAFRYFFQQVVVAALCAVIRDWTIAQIPGGAADIDQLIFSTHCFEHVARTEDLLHTCISVLKPGGAMLSLIPLTFPATTCPSISAPRPSSSARVSASPGPVVPAHPLVR